MRTSHWIDAVGLTVALLVLAFGGWIASGDDFGSINDDAALWLQAQILAGVRPAHQFDSGFITYPTVGQGLVLAPAAWLAGPGLQLGPARLWMLGLSLVATLATVSLARRRLGPALAWAVALFALVNLNSVFYLASILTEGSLTAGFALYLAWNQRSPLHPRRWAYRGLICAAFSAIRFTGLAVAAAQILVLLAGRQGQRLGYFALGFLPPMIALDLGGRSVGLGSSHYSSHIPWSDLAAMQGRHLLYFANSLGTSFLGPAPWGPLVAACLLLAFGLGAYRCRTDPQLRLALLTILIFVVGHGIWPYPLVRYYRPILAPMALIALWGLPRKLRPALALALIALPISQWPKVVGFVDMGRAQARERAQLALQVRAQLPPQAALSSARNFRLAYWSGQPCSGLETSQQASEQLYRQVRSGNRSIFVDEARSAQTYAGQDYFQVPEHWREWWRHSSLLRRGPDQRLGTLFEIRCPQALSLLKSYPLYARALQLNWADPDQRQRGETLLRAALQRTPDFPEAKQFLGVNLLEQQRLKEGRALLQEVVAQYPCGFEAAYNLAVSYQDQPDRALPILEQALTRAQSLQDSHWTSLFQAQIQALRQKRG